ncbi:MULTISPECIES: LysR family transcriptional regulator [unclassified Variovorax]|uniref:LysR family transcriptional regulator n=1 Tax=unclassified Variovorax TaxID=663243 RepID=UPI002577C05D|nr:MULTISPECIES: LysR family transcriptional regulator [unclassified Variovorax]MDM0087002.1 LysR family transcriptional regulator [Variovorax sp. J22G40]MDM0144741.1 LysR family transcriptional regulator [Variovorax sp. J2P1-31]
MDRMTSLRVFREVVDAGSFTAAAERLDISAPMASKHVAQLEKSLGARLLNRSSRHLSLTEAGESWYAQSAQALDLLDAAEAAIGRKNDAPRGQLKVSAPVWCATPHFARVLAGYHAACPEVLVDMHLENRKVDLAADGYDLALRATQEPSPALIARRLCRVQFHLVATPALLAQAGTPVLPSELARLGAIVPSYVNIEGLSLKGPGGRQAPLRLNPVLRSDDTTLTLHAVRAGLGMSFLPEWLVDDDLAAGTLVRVAPEYSAQPVTLFAVYTSRQYMAPKLRSFIDFLGQALCGDTT